MLRANNYRKIVTLIALGLVFLFLLAYALTHSVLIVSNGAENGSVTIIKKGGQSPFTAKFGINVLSTGSYSLSSTRGLSMTRKDFSINALKITRVDGRTIPQKQATKIARGADPCIFGDKLDAQKGTIYSYDCSSPRSIFVNTQSSGYSNKRILIDNIEASLTQPTNYKQGVVALASSENGSNLVNIEANGLNFYPLPDDLKNKTSPNLLLSVDSEKIYVLNKLSMIVYEYSNPSSNPVKHQLENQEGLSENTTFRVFGGDYYLLSAKSDQENTDSFSGGLLYIYNSGNQKPYKTIKTGDSTDTMFNFQLLSKDTIVGTSLQQKTVVYKIKGGGVAEDFVVSGSNKSEVVSKNLYILMDGGIYVYDPASKILNLEFGSEKTKVSSISKLGDTLTFNTTSESDSSATNNTYILGEQPVVGDYRLEDQLPYGDLELPIEWSDYFNNGLYVVISLDSLRKNPSGGFIFDQSEYEKNKKSVLDKLMADGLNGKYNITFSPY